MLHALGASDNYGRPVDDETAIAIFEGMCVNGYIDQCTTECRPALPSLASHFDDLRRDSDPRSKAVQAVRTALSACRKRESKRGDR